MNLGIRKSSFSSSPYRTLFLLLLSCLIPVQAATAQPVCANGTGWDVRYNNFAGTSTSTATCSDTFKCEKAKSTGPVIELSNPACDPKAGPCTVRLRVPLEFPGNKQNIWAGDNRISSSVVRTNGEMWAVQGTQRRDEDWRAGVSFTGAEGDDFSPPVIYASDPAFRPLAVDLVSIDPSSGSATARRDRLDE